MKTDDFLDELISSSREKLDALDDALVRLEKEFTASGNVDFELIDEIFRHFHSIKGSAGFFGLRTIVEASHKAENLLDALRKKTLRLKADYFDPMLRSGDLVRALLDALEKKVEDPELESRALSHASYLERLVEEALDADAEPKKSEESAKAKPKWGLFDAPSQEEEDDVSLEIQAAESVDDSQDESQEDSQKEIPPGFESAMPQPKWGLFNETPKKRTIIKKSKKSVPAAGGDEGELRFGARGETRDIRVAVRKLDAVMDLIGELVVSDAMLARESGEELLDIVRLRKTASQMHKIVRELQEAGLSLRMAPVEPLFRKMVRLTRDLAAQSNKKIELFMKGENTEIDKTIVELLTDPLVHIFRNAADHGLETPREREKAGKNPEGRIFLEARNNGNEIWITIRDDGRGLDREKILKQAVARGIVNEGEKMEDEDVWDLIFAPGFSTAEHITDISGRGVGMDVVRRNIQQLRGAAEVSSIPGQGTTCLLRIPLTLAIIDGMVVESSDRKFVIPTENIDSFIDLQSIALIPVQGDRYVVSIRDRLAPLIQVKDFLSYELFRGKKKEEERIAVILDKGRSLAGIRVDRILGSQQVVVKALPEYINESRGLSGSAILGDGSVALILDTGAVLEHFGSRERIMENGDISRAE